MSEEEQEAINRMKSLLLYSKEHEYFSPFLEQEIDDMDIVLKLIEKQQKQIETIKEENSKLIYENVDMYDKKQKIINKQQKEIEEKRIIIFAGAEKVKQLEKGNQSLMESRKKWKNRYYKEKAKNKDYISKDKIRKIINKYIDIEEHIKYTNQELYGEDLKNMINELI